MICAGTRALCNVLVVGEGYVPEVCIALSDEFRTSGFLVSAGASRREDAWRLGV